MLAIDAQVLKEVQLLFGKPVCRQRVGDGRSLSIGFGDKVFHSNPKKSDIFYGEWEVGTYSAAWRIVSAGRVIIGSQDVFDSVDDFDRALQTVRLSHFEAIVQSTSMDIRLDLGLGLSVEFLCVSSSDDEMFHMFAPGNQYVEYVCGLGWKVGASNAPWR